MLESIIDINPLISILSIVILNLLISGYNATIIASSVEALPAEIQKNAFLFSAGGAIILRISFTSLVLFIENIPYIETAGGLILVWISWQFFNNLAGLEKANSSESIKHIAFTIIVVNILLSFVNVTAIAGAANGRVSLLIFSLIYSLPILIDGGNWLVQWKKVLPFIPYVGGVFLAYTSAVMIFGNYGFSVIHIAGKILSLLLPWLLVIAVLAWPKMRKINLLSKGM